MFYKKPALGWLVFGLLMGNAFADTTNVKTQTIVEFKEKSVYGGTLIYPNNEPAILFADLLNKKTVSIRDLSIIADLGFRIELIKL